MKNRGIVFSAVYATTLGSLAIILLPLLFGSYVIIENESVYYSLLVNLPESFVVANYCNVLICAFYSLSISAGKLKPRWWLHILLFFTVIFVSLVFALFLTVQFISVPNPSPLPSHLVAIHFKAAFVGFFLILVIALFLKRNRG